MAKNCEEFVISIYKRREKFYTEITLEEGTDYAYC